MALPGHSSATPPAPSSGVLALVPTRPPSTRCWLTSPPVHYATLCYAGLILLFNMLVLARVVAILWSIRRQRGQARRDWVTVLGLTCLLGTTWGLAFSSFGVFLVPQLYLFTILNSLQGRRGAPGGLGGTGNPWVGSSGVLVTLLLLVGAWCTHGSDDVAAHPQVSSSASGTSPCTTGPSRAPSATPPDNASRRRGSGFGGELGGCSLRMCRGGIAGAADAVDFVRGSIWAAKLAFRAAGPAACWGLGSGYCAPPDHGCPAGLQPSIGTQH